MGIDDNLIGQYAAKLTEFSGTEYPLASEEGKELEGMVYALLEIKDDNLSPEMIIQRDSILIKLTSEKIRGFV